MGQRKGRSGERPYRGKMLREELHLVRYQKLAEPDVNYNLLDATDLKNASDYQRLVQEDHKMDSDWKSYLSNRRVLLKLIAEEKGAKLKRKRREKDEENDDNCCDEEENDPQYELFLTCLKEHEKSYIVEGEKNGLPIIIKYERESGSDAECDLEPGRKLRSAMKQKNGPSDQMAGVENQHKHDSQSTQTKETKKVTQRKLRNKSENEKEKNVKISTKNMVPDPDYLTFINSLELVNADYYAYKNAGHTVVYEMKNGGSNHVKEEDNDGSFSDVEILESAFINEGNPNISMMNTGSSLNPRDTTRQCQSEFRRKVIAVLRKPYCKQEYDKLWQDIELRKPEERHLELRNGRERSYSIQKYGKSYLDHHPGLRRKLLQVQDNKTKCLNLLRGFFCWVKHPAAPFYPWEDAECLAINPKSG